MSIFLLDLRHSLRALRHSPAFSIVAIVVLGLGIGVNATVFSLVNAMLIRPLPGQADTRVVGLFSRDTTEPDTYRAFSWPEYEDLRAGVPGLSHVTAHNVTLVGIDEAGSTKRVFASVVAASYFDTLGVPVARGRGFTAAEERPGAGERVAVVSETVARRLGDDPLGATIKVNGEIFTVVGVAARGFSGTSAFITPDVWLPVGVHDLVASDMASDSRRDLSRRDTRSLMLLGRLAPGATIDALGPALEEISARVEAEYPADSRGQVIVARPLSRMSISTSPTDDSQAARMSVLLLSMSGIVLLIASLNLANMVLARNASRRKDVAVRLAIGAGRARVVRQLLTEGFVLAIAGGLLGFGLAWWASRAMVSSLVAVLPLSLAIDLTPDLRVLAATLTAALVATVAFTLVPALKLVAPSVVDDLKQQAGEAGRPGARGWFSPRNLLVVTQVALSLTLLATGGLFLRGALRASVADPGFPLERGVIASLDPSLDGADETRSRATYHRVLERVRSLPGVEAASLASIVPFGEFTVARQVFRAGEPTEGPDARARGVRAISTIVTADYFESVRLPVLIGRAFTMAEERAPSGLRAVVIDEPLAAQLWPGRNPLGERLQLPSRGGVGAADVLEVIGVVAGVRHSLFDRDPVPHIYLPFGEHFQSAMTLHVGLAEGASEQAVAGVVRQALREVDAGLPVLSLQTLGAFRDRNVMLWMVRTGGRLFTAFGLAALLLAAVGLYGVKAYVVSRRTREIGIRMALGATHHDVLWMVWREGLSVAFAGIAIGFVLSVLAGQAVSRMLYEVSPLDPVVFATASAVLVVAMTLACYLPARRATRVAPIEALRM